MITNEQIKNLRLGDPLIIHGKFEGIYKDGDIAIEVTTTGGYGEGGVIKDTHCVHPSCVSLPSVPETTPKYDPCRKFQEGDIVDYRRIYGRDYETVPDPEDYEFARVISAEDAESGMVGVEFIAAYGGEDVYFAVPWFHLELVTPVEELEPYCVRKYSSFYAVEKHNNLKDRPATYDIDFHPHAKEAAEAERDRLNAEWKTKS